MAAKPAAPSTAHVALLRGINVGGKHIVPMKEMATIFAEAKCSDVRTYIQSGNVVFSAAPAVLQGLRERLEKKFMQRFGFAVPVILRSAAQIASTLRNNPFLRSGVAENQLHVYFLADLPTPDAVKALDPNRSAPDVFQVLERQIYLHVPNGMGRTKLTSTYFDSRLSTVCTARNWATIQKLSEMMRV